jgi:DNA-binding protein HU-beta
MTRFYRELHVEHGAGFEPVLGRRRGTPNDEHLSITEHQMAIARKATTKPASKPAVSKTAVSKTAVSKTAVAKTAATKSAAVKTTAAKVAAPAPTVTLKTITSDLAEKYELSKKDANLLMGDFVTHVVKNLKKGNRIRIPGLGSLQVRKHAARKGRNPATGESIKIPAKKKIAFRAAKDLKEAVGK